MLLILPISSLALILSTLLSVQTSPVPADSLDFVQLAARDVSFVRDIDLERRQRGVGGQGGGAGAASGAGGAGAGAGVRFWILQKFARS